MNQFEQIVYTGAVNFIAQMIVDRKVIYNTMISDVDTAVNNLLKPKH